VLVRELHLTTARTRMRSTKLSPLPSLHESGELVCVCEPNLTAAQPVANGTPPSRASFPLRCASAIPTCARVLSSTRVHTCPMAVAIRATSLESSSSPLHAKPQLTVVEPKSRPKVAPFPAQTEA
jgi:hypothetical protein